MEAGDEWVRRETRRLGHVGFLTGAHTADGILFLLLLLSLHFLRL